MKDTDRFGEESEAMSSGRNHDSLTLFDDGHIIEETRAGVILGWLAPRIARLLGDPARPGRTPKPSPPDVERNPRELSEIGLRHPRQLGWSLTIAVFAIVTLALVTIATGATTVGVIACGGLTVSVCALVAAEIISRD